MPNTYKIWFTQTKDDLLDEKIHQILLYIKSPL